MMFLATPVDVLLAMAMALLGVSASRNRTTAIHQTIRNEVDLSQYVEEGRC